MLESASTAQRQVSTSPSGSDTHAPTSTVAPGAAADYLNLAEVLSDGRKVTVPAEAELSPGEQYGPSEDEDGVVDINRAGKEELMTLPGIGEARAEAVIAYREEHGGFSSPEEIMKVPGIKEASYEKLKDKITAGP